MDKNTTPNRNGDNKNNGRFPKNTQNMMMFLVFLMIGFLLWGFVRDQYTQATTQEVTYDKFLEMLENDEIASVEDTGATWEITPKSEENKTVKVTSYTGKMDDEGLLPLMKEMFAFIAGYEGDVPGASARDCGNYLDMNLPMANYLARKYLDEVLESITEDQLHYPE